MANNFMPNHVTIKLLATALRRGGLLPEDYFKDRNFSNRFIKSAVVMGFHHDEAKLQILTDKNYCERKEKQNEPRNVAGSLAPHK